MGHHLAIVDPHPYGVAALHAGRRTEVRLVHLDPPVQGSGQEMPLDARWTPIIYYRPSARHGDLCRRDLTPSEGGAPLTPASYRKRVLQIQAGLVAQGLDGMIVVKPEHVRYVSGLWGYSTRPEYAMPRRLIAVVLPASGAPTLIVPKIEAVFARRATWLGDVRHHLEWKQGDEPVGGLALLARVLREKGLIGGRLGVETGFISAKLYQMLATELPGTTLEDTAAILEEIRMVKSPEEIAALRVAGRMAVREYQAEARAIAAGVAEYEVATQGRDAGTREYARALRRDRAGSPLTSPLVDGMQIITSGERLDMVHAWASVRRIRKGEVVLLDFCRLVQYLGYRVGFARIVSLRRPSAEEREMYRVTLDAFHQAVALVRPGVRACEPDILARELLTKAGLAETFVHRTGRGVGLENAERPEIQEHDQTVLQPGMVVTIEPSIYFPHFAVHVEDTFVVTRNGAEVLTPAPRELRILR
jgi:Xaa-Pro aminopeptidase